MSDLVRSVDVSSLPQRGGVVWTDAMPRDDEAVDPRHLVYLLLRRKKEILFVALLVLIPAVIATLLQQKLYRATATLQIDPEPLQILPNANLDAPRPAFEVFMRTQEQVLLGPTLLSRVAARLPQEGDAAVTREVARLRKSYTALRLENTQMINVSYVAPEPATAAKIANLFTDEFIKLQFEGQQKARDNARQLLERDLKKVEDQIQGLERELITYSSAHERGGDRLDRQQLADRQLTTLVEQTLSADSEVATARARVAALSGASRTQFPEPLVTAVIQSRLSTLFQLEHDLTALRTSFGENWPSVVQKRDEIAVVREQIDREKDAVLAQARAQAAVELRAAEGKQRTLRTSRSEQEGRLSALQDASVQYNILQRNVETNRKLHEGMLERLKQMSVAPGIDLASIRVIEIAVPDLAVVSPRIGWNIFLASLLGLALGISVAVARDYWANTLSSIGEIEQVTMLPVLAAIPLVRAAGSKRLWSIPAALKLLSRSEDAAAAEVPPAAATKTAAGSAHATPPPISLASDPNSAEAVRTLCASLLLSTAERPPRVIVVTSVLPGEGKTTIASQLGRALAESGAKTLLVEGDMRRPGLATQYGVGRQGGLSLYLAGQSDEVTTHQTDVERLYVATAGPAAPNPVALLSSERLTRFVSESARSFHFVIIDTPPLASLADARVIGAKADGVVLVVRAGRVSKSLLRRVRTQLDHSGCRVLGAVFNAVDFQETDSPYYNYQYQ